MTRHKPYPSAHDTNLGLRRIDHGLGTLAHGMLRVAYKMRRYGITGWARFA